jgi:hypothetical protein
MVHLGLTLASFVAFKPGLVDDPPWPQWTLKESEEEPVFPIGEIFKHELGPRLIALGAGEDPN